MRRRQRVKTSSSSGRIVAGKDEESIAGFDPPCSRGAGSFRRLARDDRDKRRNVAGRVRELQHPTIAWPGATAKSTSSSELSAATSSGGTTTFRSECDRLGAARQPTPASFPGRVAEKTTTKKTALKIVSLLLIFRGEHDCSEHDRDRATKAGPPEQEPAREFVNWLKRRRHPDRDGPDEDDEQRCECKSRPGD